MLKCKFISEESICHLCKAECNIPTKNISNCEYYQRQHPKDLSVMQNRVLKALSKAVKKRDLSGESSLPEDISVDMNLSIYENVQKNLQGITSNYTLQVKEKRKLSKEEYLNPSLLENLTQNLYKTVEFTILQRLDEKNQLIARYAGEKVLITLSIPIQDFFKGIKEDINPSLYLKSSIEEMVKI